MDKKENEKEVDSKLQSAGEKNNDAISFQNNQRRRRNYKQ